MKKNTNQKQLLIYLGIVIAGISGFTCTATPEKIIGDGLMSGWRNAKKNNDPEAISLIATAIDNFAILQKNYASATEQYRTELAMYKNKTLELEKELQQAKTDLRESATINKTVADTERARDEAHAQRDTAVQELQRLQKEYNTLRGRLALLNATETSPLVIPNT